MIVHRDIVLLPYLCVTKKYTTELVLGFILFSLNTMKQDPALQSLTDEHVHQNADSSRMGSCTLTPAFIVGRFFRFYAQLS